MPHDISGFSHVRLTVRDIAKSKEFYDSVFGFEVFMQADTDADEATQKEQWWLFGGVVYQVAEGVLLGLRPVADDGDRFDADRVGLDHVSFEVSSRHALDVMAANLEEHGIEHEDIKDIGLGHILEFRDPDGVALELFALAETSGDSGDSGD